MNETDVANRSDGSERCELLRAMYNFTSNSHYAKSLTFHTDDVFIIYEISTKKRQWWEVVNGKGDVGYVPSNYVSTIQVTLKFFLKFLDGCIQVMKREEEKCGGRLTPDRQKLLNFLVERRFNACQGAEANASRCVSDGTQPCVSQASVVGAGDHNNVVHASSNSQEETAASKPTIGSGFASEHVARNDEAYINKSSSAHSAVKADKHGRKSKSEHRIKTRAPEPSHKTSLDHNSVSGAESVTSASHASDGHGASTSSALAGAKESLRVDKSKEPEIAYQLVDQVRQNTRLSFDMSRVAIGVVISRVQELLTPGADPLGSACLDGIVTLCRNQMSAPRNLLEDTYDARRLRVIFTEMTSCKEDSQQRSWMLHEDEPTIIEYIKEMSAILTDADPNVSRHMMSLDHYNAVSTLVQYYQMETRWSIRQPLLQVFGVMCHLDATVVTLMLNSVLPPEVARDMQANAGNTPRLLCSALLLTMVFATGEPMPLGHFDYLGQEFITFLVECIENPPETDLEEQISDKFLNLILAYNLQFKSPQENCVLNGLEQRSNAKTFTEKALILYNREEDPVNVFEHTASPAHSVHKLFIDLFNRRQTASLFYTNDVKVLIDIITRHLSDLSPGDKRRGHFLHLCQLVMRNSSYEDHLHRCEDIHKCFMRIFCEELEDSLEDQRLVRVISNEFPHYFKA